MITLASVLHIVDADIDRSIATGKKSTRRSGSAETKRFELRVDMGGVVRSGMISKRLIVGEVGA